MKFKVGKLKYYSDKIIGQGNFGTVFSGILRGGVHGGDNKPVAVKRLERSRVDESLIQREVELMIKACDHPNILRYICTEMNGDFLFVGTELCIGTLEDYLTKNEIYQGPRFESEREMLYQLTQGLAYLHSLGIVHRDIKPTNILICSNNMMPKDDNDSDYSNHHSPDDGVFEPEAVLLMKLGDFGLSKVLQTNKEDFTNTSVANPSGTKGWMPPEVYEFNRIDFKVDVWALGCIFAYTLSGGKHPFGDDIKRLLRIIGKEAMILVQEDFMGPYLEDGISFQLIQNMLEVDPVIRPTVEAILKCDFFNFISDRPTQQLLDVCASFKDSIDAEKITQFENLVNGANVNINATTRRRKTPLHLLLRYYENENLIDLVQLLIQYGADMNAKDLDGNTPLHVLCSFYQKENLINIIQLLIQSGAEINAKNGNEETPLHLICMYYGNENLIYIVQLLIQKGADINATSYCEGLNEGGPLHYLCLYYSKDNLIDVVTLLIENGADLNAETADGKTPLHCLKVSKGNENKMNQVQRLIQKGAK